MRLCPLSPGIRGVDFTFEEMEIVKRMRKCEEAGWRSVI
jgi:hypothetical protein